MTLNIKRARVDKSERNTTHKILPSLRETEADPFLTTLHYSSLISNPIMKLWLITVVWMATRTSQAFVVMPRRTTTTTTSLCQSLNANNHKHPELTEVVAADNRRTFLATAMSLFLGTMTAYELPVHAVDTTRVNYKAVSNDIAKLVQKNPDWGPTYVLSTSTLVEPARLD